MENKYESIAGSYWLCRTKNNSLWITQGNKPIKSNDGYRRKSISKDDLNWFELIDDKGDPGDGELVGNFLGFPKFPKDAFEGLKFPKVTWEDGPLEIEITKSGKVYWYES